ncbi:cysteine desulfurase iscS [Faustovirus]|nr:cysteine desulfurase [Faustovirus]QJX72188.1 cysteine desulfurase iscS [Faustovirus]QJX72683.1 cysteine desulfurase iscS [Faustovirus]QJX73179.1 cysteine desulfurase iscS [Faustovirus]QJX73686.1 cysteine desulfurase iscS [Faustovirus]
MIYLDNNSTTIMPKATVAAFTDYCNRGNPSSSYPSANKCKDVMAGFRDFIAANCGFEVDTNDIDYEDIVANVNNGTLNINTMSPMLYKIIFTSCGSESNAMIIQGVIRSYRKIAGDTPHIISSAIEHKSVLDCLKSYAEDGEIQLTLIPPMINGTINPADVEANILPNTCLITIMHANNETGAINDIATIAKIAHKFNVPFHSDSVQTFGKFKMDLPKLDIDAITVSFHKYHGPPGIGALIIRSKFLYGYQIPPLIFGSQNYHLRGGTENMPGLAAAYAGLAYTWEKRSDKNARMLQLKIRLKKNLETRYKIIPYSQHYKNFTAQSRPPATTKPYIVMFHEADTKYTPNTMLISVVASPAMEVCNSKIKKALEEAGIIVSIGSACNTKSSKASHVLFAMQADKWIRRGTIRVSLGDETTEADIDKFVGKFSEIVAATVVPCTKGKIDNK